MRLRNNQVWWENGIGMQPSGCRKRSPAAFSNLLRVCILQLASGHGPRSVAGFLTEAVPVHAVHIRTKCPCFKHFLAFFKGVEEAVPIKDHKLKNHKSRNSLAWVTHLILCLPKHTGCAARRTLHNRCAGDSVMTRTILSCYGRSNN